MKLILLNNKYSKNRVRYNPNFSIYKNHVKSKLIINLYLI